MRLHENELVFRGEKELPDNLKVLNTPYDCFCYFVNEELLQEISTQSNLYAHQKCIQTKFKVDHIELRKFLGVLIFMSVYRYPNVRSYWGRHALEEIRETMTVLRFEEIRRYIHFCDNTAAPEKENPEYDNLYKIRLLVNHFNDRHMGGVDLMDGLLGRYHIRMKTRKWTSRIFYHLIDVAMVNSYILYHRLHPEMGKLNLPLFRTEVAESLCKHKTVTNKKAVGRPSISSPIASPIQVHRSYIPTEDIRYDQVGHWCTFRDRSGKKQCKFDNCFAETQAFCIKCKLSLCNSPAKNCFYKFHNK